MASQIIAPQIDVEFSSALHNRTGKYVVGRDLIDDCRDLIGAQWYWRLDRPAPPVGLAARALGRLLAMEVDGRRASALFDRALPRFRPRRPVLHIDPFTVTFHRLTKRDLVLCHDVGPVTHPALFAPTVVELYGRAYAEIAAVGPNMVFVSRASQRAFHDLYPGRFTSSRVIYNAIRGEIATGEAARLAGVEPPFLLTIGSVGERKNQLRCIRAFERSGLAASGLSYVICGAREPGWEAVQSAARTTPGVHLFGYVSDGELTWLYDHAAGFVLASLLEGFGVPVAEAIVRGLVPLVTRESVLHEVAGDGAYLTSAEDEGEIASAMTALATMTTSERAARLAALTRSVGRFARSASRLAWRTALAEHAGEA